MSELVYVQELWRKRAEVAQECADELGELATALNYVLRANYFGSGCVEGDLLFDALTRVLRGGSRSLARSSTDAASLATASEHAIAEMEAADAEESIGE
ncbi:MULTISPECIES: hypothetical protein [Gordonia]|uniref:hypothetical protein n=1 Tax=Gordonia TaxID=2053 RepID=UPI000C7AC27A|nr:MULTISPECIES: hypothetical protein [Gordonia]AUH70457.1 hypothetical protein CXX93_16715 [Gordonia sp. YC-JH1]WFN93760.1 hypothetical protein P5P27_04165 [Gordonia sihwensis]